MFSAILLDFSKKMYYLCKESVFKSCLIRISKVVYRKNSFRKAGKSNNNEAAERDKDI